MWSTKDMPSPFHCGVLCLVLILFIRVLFALARYCSSFLVLNHHTPSFIISLSCFNTRRRKKQFRWNCEFVFISFLGMATMFVFVCLCVGAKCHTLNRILDFFSPIFKSLFIFMPWHLWAFCINHEWKFLNGMCVCVCVSTVSYSVCFFLLLRQLFYCFRALFRDLSIFHQ